MPFRHQWTRQAGRAVLAMLVPFLAYPNAARAETVREVDIPSLNRTAPNHAPPPEKGPAQPNPDLDGLIVMLDANQRTIGAWFTGRRGRSGVSRECLTLLETAIGQPLPKQVGAVCGPYRIKRLTEDASALIARAREANRLARLEPLGPAATRPADYAVGYARRAVDPVPPPLPRHRPAILPGFSFTGPVRIVAAPNAPTAGTEPASPDVALPPHRPSPPAPRLADLAAATAPAPQAPTPAAIDRPTPGSARRKSPVPITADPGGPVIVLITDAQGAFTGTWFTESGKLTDVPRTCQRILQAAAGFVIPPEIRTVCGTVRLYGLGSGVGGLEAVPPPAPETAR